MIFGGADRHLGTRGFSGTLSTRVGPPAALSGPTVLPRTKGAPSLACGLAVRYQPGPVRSGRPQRASQLPACFLQTVGLPLPCQRRQLHPRGMRRPRPLTPSLSPLFVKAETESPLHSPSPPYFAPEIPPPADPQTQYGLTSVIVPAKLRATVLSVCRAIHCPRAFSAKLKCLLTCWREQKRQRCLQL